MNEIRFGTRLYSTLRVLLLAALILLAPQSTALGEMLEITINEKGQSDPVPARVHLRRSGKGAVLHPELPSWRDHFVCPGRARIEVQPGKYELTVERGPEYRRASASLEVRAGAPTVQRVELERLIDMTDRGWWSGDLHVHRALEEMPLHLRAEDLHVAPVLTVWNQRNLWRNRPLPRKQTERVVTVDGDRVYHVLACEDERQGGALLFFNLDSPLDLSGQGREYPSPIFNLGAARKQSHVWIDIEKPFWWDVPTWAMSGAINSVGLANNHMCRSRMLANEAWGFQRDTGRLPPPRGNGFHSQELYYRLLNCGFRIPPSAGSASGVLPNPVGYNRVYVHLEEFSDASWWRGLAAGRCFVTNGPMLLVTAKSGERKGLLPGSVLVSPGDKKLGVELHYEIIGNDPIERIEVIQDGKVTWKTSPRSDTSSTRGTVAIEFTESGWCILRVIAAVKETFRFASSAPFYAEVGEQPRTVHREDVEYFIAWLEARIKQIERGTREKLTGEKLESVLEPHRKALGKYRELLK